MRLIIDRFEGKYAVCEDEEQVLYAVAREELPPGAETGSALTLSLEGTLLLDLEETRRRRDRIAEKQRQIFGK